VKTGPGPESVTESVTVFKFGFVFEGGWRQRGGGAVPMP
jgi:hypothetical protein